MKIYESFEIFWKEFSSDKLNSFKFHDWQVVQILHTNDHDYAGQRKDHEDNLGFQPLSLKLANPFTKQTKQILIKNVNDNTANKLREFCRDRYIKELGNRFNSFTPDVFDAFAEYDSWESFYKSWQERNNVPVFNLNVPLLFDHTPKIEYWTRKQTGQEIMPYQRLLVTTFLVSKNQFFDFFIKDVSDEEFKRIKLLTQSRIGLDIDKLF